MPEVHRNLRPATPADLALLRYWDTMPHVIAADPNDDWAWEDELGEDSCFVYRLERPR